MAEKKVETGTPQKDKAEGIKAVPLGNEAPTPKENVELPNDFKERLDKLEKENAELKSTKTVKAEPVKEKVYFTPKHGDIQMCIPVQKDGKTVSTFVKFQNGRFTTSKLVEQEFLEEMMKQDESKPIKLRRVISEDTFDSVQTPDNLMVSINGNMMNIKEVREGIDFAIDKGWVPKYKEYIQSPYKVSVSKGGLTAGGQSRKS